MVDWWLIADLYPVNGQLILGMSCMVTEKVPLARGGPRLGSKSAECPSQDRQA